jgi:hypothetical protein
MSVMQGKKPLHRYEQGMLLSAMLFDRKNLPDILKFFPDEQADRMGMAKEKFMALPHNEWMTQIVLELRRLLLIDENRIDWIHKSWIEDALAKDPPYLKKIIKQAIDAHMKKNCAISASSGPHLLPLILRMFINQLTKTSQKIAIYDPVLMRFQSLKDETQKESFTTIGLVSIDALSLVIDRNRLHSYLAKKGQQALPSINIVLPHANPYHNDKLRRHFLQELIRIRICDEVNCVTKIGLITAAFYLSHHKYQWQRAIILGLHQKFGQFIEQIIMRIKNLNLDHNSHTLLSLLLIGALDYTTC